jgi:hypothetical protein
MSAVWNIQANAVGYLAPQNRVNQAFIDGERVLFVNPSGFRSQTSDGWVKPDRTAFLPTDKSVLRMDVLKSSYKPAHTWFQPYVVSEAVIPIGFNSARNRQPAQNSNTSYQISVGDNEIPEDPDIPPAPFANTPEEQAHLRQQQKYERDDAARDAVIHERMSKFQAIGGSEAEIEQMRAQLSTNRKRGAELSIEQARQNTENAKRKEEEMKASQPSTSQEKEPPQTSKEVGRSAQIKVIEDYQNELLNVLIALDDEKRALPDGDLRYTELAEKYKRFEDLEYNGRDMLAALKLNYEVPQETYVKYVNGVKEAEALKVKPSKKKEETNQESSSKAETKEDSQAAIDAAMERAYKQKLADEEAKRKAEETKETEYAKERINIIRGHQQDLTDAIDELSKQRKELNAAEKLNPTTRGMVRLTDLSDEIQKFTEYKTFGMNMEKDIQNGVKIPVEKYEKYVDVAMEAKKAKPKPATNSNGKPSTQ